MRARRERLPAGTAAAGGHGAHLHAHRREPGPGPGHLGRARPPAQRHGTGLHNDLRPHLRVRLAPVKATIDCSSGVPVVTSPTVEGSRFPSHRLWLDGAMMHDVRQGPLSALWRRAGRSDPCPLDASAVCIIHDTKVIDLSLGNDVHYFDLTVLRRPLSLRSLACMVSRRICCLLHPR
jgi:hypothetical protein